MIACKAAVKAGKPLETVAQRALLSQLADRQSVCLSPRAPDYDRHRPARTGKEIRSRLSEDTMDVAVTTSRRSTPENIRRATRYRAACTVYLSRRTFIGASHGVCRAHLHRRVIGVLVVTENLSVWTPQSGSLYYHPGMALNQWPPFGTAAVTPWWKAMQLRPGDHVLLYGRSGLRCGGVCACCRLYRPGAGLESVAVLALLLKNGLARYCCDNPALNIAIRRVAFAISITRSFSLPVRQPALISSTSIRCSRTGSHQSRHRAFAPAGHYDSLTTETLDLASSVAAFRGGQRPGGPLHTTLEWDDIRGGRRSRIVYLLQKRPQGGFPVNQEVHKPPLLVLVGPTAVEKRP